MPKEEKKAIQKVLPSKWKSGLYQCPLNGKISLSKHTYNADHESAKKQS